MDPAQLHVGSPLSLSQWLADWPLQRKRHESELVEPKRVSLRVPLAETESRPRNSDQHAWPGDTVVPTFRDR